MAFEARGRPDYTAEAHHLIGLLSHYQGRYAEALQHYNKALTAREQLRDLKGLSTSYNNIGLIYWAQGQYSEALAFHQMAMTTFEQIGDLEGLSGSYNNIGLIYQERGQYPEALAYYEKALTIREQIEDWRGLSASYNNIGLIYQEQGQYDKALIYYQRALQIFYRLNNLRGLADSYNNIGNIYSNQGRYAEAFAYHQKSLQIKEQLGDQQGLADSYNNIGNIYCNQGRYAEALAYHQKSLQIKEQLGDQQGLADSYNNIGNVYSDQGQYIEALESHQKSLQIRVHLGDQRGLAHSYNNIGNIYKALGRYDEALAYHQKSLRVEEQLNNQEGLAISYYDIGDLYRRWGLYTTARTYLYRALILARRLALRDNLKDIYLSLALTDAALAASGEPTYWKSAYEYARFHTTYKDSVLNEESIRKQAQLQSQYEYDKREALLRAEQGRERLLATAMIQRRETQRNLSLIALGAAGIGISILTYFFFIIRRQKRRLQEVNIALAESNQIIQAQSEALIEKNEEVLDSIRYAKQIQQAILPSVERWRHLLPESFFIYRPKDIVAGDFYWIEETEKYIFLGIADATGHGVPGAFVSLICANALNVAVVEARLESPRAILERARTSVSKQLTQENGKLRDGMDIALVRLEKQAPWKLNYAGANRPLWIVSGQELIDLKPTRQSVGYTEIERPFEEIAMDLRSRLPAMVYMFTDGITDQMGGPKGRKILAKGLREALLEIADLPCSEQEGRLRAFLSSWQGDRQQMDDITLIGIRLSSALSPP